MCLHSFGFWSWRLESEIKQNYNLEQSSIVPSFWVKILKNWKSILKIQMNSLLNSGASHFGNS